MDIQAKKAYEAIRNAGVCEEYKDFARTIVGALTGEAETKAKEIVCGDVYKINGFDGNYVYAFLSDHQLVCIDKLFRTPDHNVSFSGPKDSMEELLKSMNKHGFERVGKFSELYRSV